MCDLTDEINKFDLLIESTKDEFNDYAEALLNEYSFDEVKPLLESAHFEAELIITEAEDVKVNKIKEAGEKAKSKVEDKFNSPAYTKKCKEIEEAIKTDPSVGEQLVEVPAVDKICKQVISVIKSGKKIDRNIMEQREQITLKQLMLKRKRIQTIIGVTIGVVATAGVVLAGKVINDTIKTNTDRKQNQIKSDLKELEMTKTPKRSNYDSQKSYEDAFVKFSDEINTARYNARKDSEQLDILKDNNMKLVKEISLFISLLVGVANMVYFIIMQVDIKDAKMDIKQNREMMAKMLIRKYRLK